MENEANFFEVLNGSHTIVAQTIFLLLKVSDSCSGHASAVAAGALVAVLPFIFVDGMPKEWSHLRMDLQVISTYHCLVAFIV